jgi:hypothetical protein
VSTGQRSLDELEPGSAEAWAEFFLSENPREAEEMIRAELPLSPGSPGLWRLLAEAMEGQGKSDEAFDHYATATNILPDTRTMRQAAAILAQRGNDQELLDQTIDRIRYIERLTEPDRELDLLRARSLSHGGLEGVRAALPLYEELWAHREQLRTPGLAYDLGQGYAVALLHRGDPADAELINSILDGLLQFVQDPYRRDLLQAYSYLARWMQAVRTEEAGEEEAAAGDAPEEAQAQGAEEAQEPEQAAEEDGAAPSGEEAAPGDEGAAPAEEDAAPVDEDAAPPDEQPDAEPTDGGGG